MHRECGLVRSAGSDGRRDSGDQAVGHEGHDDDRAVSAQGFCLFTLRPECDKILLCSPLPLKRGVLDISDLVPGTIPEDGIQKIIGRAIGRKIEEKRPVFAVDVCCGTRCGECPKALFHLIFLPAHAEQRCP